MTSKLSRVSGVYGLLTLIEVQGRVLFTTRGSLHVKVFTGVFTGGWPELLGAHSFTGIPLAQKKWNLGAGRRRLSLPGVKASPGRQKQGAGCGRRGESKVCQPSVRV